MKIAYFDCFSGISGDMTLGALVDLGLPEKTLLDELKKLDVQGYSIRIGVEKRGAIAGTRVEIDIERQPSRTYSDIRQLIEASSLEGPIRERSLAVFDRLAKAEARVHRLPVSEVHFHEVGALDSILDIVGTAVGLQHLGIDRVCASRLPLGRGFVETKHGLLPVPAPATVLLLEGAPVYDNGIERELVTPTGAAILAALADSFGPIPEMTLSATGFGVGRHPASDPPNLLRIMVGTSVSGLISRDLLVIETNIDDMNPEFYDYALDRLFALGALDVGLIPVQMKKNRPGTLLRALVEPALESAVVELILKETTSLGVRIQRVKRVELPREVKSVATPFGPCRVKCVVGPDGAERTVPEYDECRRIAEQYRKPIREVYEEIALAGRSGGGLKHSET